MSFYGFLWNFPLKRLVLGRDEMHIWRAALEGYQSNIQTLEQILAVDQLTRVDRFNFPKGSKHFISTRGLLEVTLGYYLTRVPHTLHFCYSHYDIRQSRSGKAVVTHCLSISLIRYPGHQHKRESPIAHPQHCLRVC